MTTVQPHSTYARDFSVIWRNMLTTVHENNIANYKTK